MSAAVLREAAALMRARAEAATPGPWDFNTYSAVRSQPMVEAEGAFWTDERENDGHTYDHRVGQVCPECGERPAVYGDDANPEVRGQRFGTYWDCARHKDAYDADSLVAHVPAEYGDTSTGRHRNDADHIASWHPAAALAVADWLYAESHQPEIEHEGGAYTTGGPSLQALAVARAYLSHTNDARGN